ncbi:receptor protein-tyrosine kinase CEPR2-like [Ipomoea triloba]|uniref:receptor protein-tyrosine kinase CEPR2-like n=1 Tax=Ipomoea triloba TaxID=35885 RepID=UPI00125E8839|nr:receptor protein-tyrosine kinase CEPR2-like [Ipomoea triloba]
MARNIELQPLGILSIFVFLFLFFVPSRSSSLNVETQALLEFKRQIIDPLNHLESWKDTESPCRFYGITCDRNTGLVTGISLDSKNLSGVISPSIFLLKSLASIVLPSNLLSGALPGELANFTGLRVLNVTGNSLSGTIPDLSKLTGLEILDLSINYFSGDFPTWPGNLTGLIGLGLGDNSYNEGMIPESLGNLKNLTWLYLAGSNLSGEIPESIFGLEKLQTLDICRNQVSGNIPKLIGKMRNLLQIELYENDLTGELPLEIAELTLLQQFDVSNNKMYGALPPGIGKLRFLTVFHVFKNNFSGELPPGFGDMEHLFAFSIYMNSFTGEIPENLGRFSPLNAIDLSENKFSGSFPKYLCQNGNLQQLVAVENSFSGEFPDTYGSCKGLVRLRVTKNQLSGKIPDGVWALPSLNMMDFSYNSFTGGISPRIGAATTLEQLILSNNKFSSELPGELGKLTLLQRLHLDNNDFSGPLPSELGLLNQISSLHFEKNSFTGSIPAEFGQCSRLADLNLASNHLSGSIPESITTMASLNSLNLSSNKLTGLIPRGLDNLKLSLIDLSNNQLSGEVSNDFLTMHGDKAFLGNKELCVDHTIKAQFNTELSSCDGKGSHHETMKKRLAVLLIVLFALAVLLCGLLVASYWSHKYSETDTEKRCGESKGLDRKWKLESFHQIEFDADEICNVDEDSLIGSGGTGKVYKLDLKKGCGTVAIKKLWKGNGVKLLSREMEILGSIRHRNIVKLYASLIKEGSNFLVFEYMPNGNLFQALHHEIKSGKPELDWDLRYKIALGAAKGIAYLHHDCSPPIIHRDIKSTNILLDESYEAKVSDFGVAKISEVSPRGSEFSCFAGTHGYMAPEMAYTLRVSEKSDVYSFGVVLLELVTGRHAIEDAYGEGKDIVYWVATQLENRENVITVLDTKVGVEDAVQDEMIKVLRIATLCTTKLPNLRPSMKEVVNMLVDAEPSTFKSGRNFEKTGKVFL